MIRVLLVEDDPMVRQVNLQFLQQIEGIQVVGMATNGIEGLEQVKLLKPDLILMDVFMPLQNGVETLEKIRQLNITVDVIAVTAANDKKTIERILHLGAFDYIMKPFSFERMKVTFDNYLRFKQTLNSKIEMNQDELDHIFHPLKQEGHYHDVLPKGLNGATLEKILQFMKIQQQTVTAVDVSTAVGLARVTARRYLDYLEKNRDVEIVIQYGGVGRPVNQYRLIRF